MKQETKPQAVIIDDDLINNFLCHKVIELAIPDAMIETFTEPEKGLAYIQSAYSDTGGKHIILFLDINMYPLTGWDVLEQIERSPHMLRSNLKIFMLSSSVNAGDKEKAHDNPLVVDYIIKPLSETILKTIFAEY